MTFNSQASSLSPELLHLSQKILKKGSKSFSFASRLFNPETQLAVALLYHWCRYCDDAVDEISHLDSRACVEELKALTQSACSLEEPHSSLPPAFQALRWIVRRYQIPVQYPLDLIDGFQMDASSCRYKSFSELRLYCYRVAGAVGVMMTYIMGASSPRALQHAAELGIAMQLTNISRDVQEDLERDRLYLPIDSDRTLSADSLYEVTQVVITESEHHYKLGLQGLQYLPFQASVTVAAAALIYREIGREILSKGPEALLSRTVVSKPKKIICVLKAFVVAFKVRIFKRERWARCTLPDQWRFSP